MLSFSLKKNYSFFFKLLFFPLIIIFLSFFSLSFSVSSANLNFNGVEVHYLAKDAVLRATLNFSIKKEGNNFPFLSIRTEGFTLLKNLNFRRDCISDENYFYCNLPVLIKAPGLKNVSFNIEGVKQNFSFNIEEDDSLPKLVSLKTNFCKNDICYVGSSFNTDIPGKTKLIADFEDNVTSFYYKLVRFKLNNDFAHAYSCNEHQCFANITNPFCRDGNILSLSVVNYAINMPSSEDALNPVVSSLKRKVVCDSKAPIIENVDIFGSDYKSILFKGSFLIINTTVKENTNVSLFVKNTGFTDDNYSISCTPLSDDNFNNNLFNCFLKIPLIKEGTFPIKLIFRDAVGNSVVKGSSIIILDSNFLNNNQTFKIQIKSIEPYIINRAALYLAYENNLEYPVIINYLLKPAGFDDDNLSIVSIDEDSLVCYWSKNRDLKNGSLLSDSSSSYFSFDNNNLEDGLIYINFLDDPSIMPDNIYVNCSFNYYFKNQTVFFQEPKKINFSFSLKLKNSVLGTPADALLEKFNAVETINNSFYKTIGTLTKVYNIMDDLCLLMSVFKTVAGAGSTMEAIGLIVPFLGDSLVASGYSLYLPAIAAYNVNSGDIVGGLAKDSKIIKNLNSKSWLRDACMYITCSNDKPKLPFLINPAKLLGIKDEQKASLFNNITAPSYGDSLLASLGLYGTPVCLKGVLYNLNKWITIKCGYVACLKEQSLYGYNLAVCEEAKGYKTCTNIVGELFQLPFVNIFTQLSGFINSIIQNLPLMLIKQAASEACSMPANVPLSTEGIFANMFKSVGSLFKGLFSKTVFNFNSLFYANPLLSYNRYATFSCHLLNTIWVSSDVGSFSNKASGFSLDHSFDICDAALCSSDDIINGNCKSSTSFFGLDQNDRLALEGIRDHYIELKKSREKEKNKDYVSGFDLAEKSVTGFDLAEKSVSDSKENDDTSSSTEQESNNKVIMDKPVSFEEKRNYYSKIKLSNGASVFDFCSGKSKEFNGIEKCFDLYERQATLNMLAANLVYKWLADNNYLEKLQLSSWGSWGRKIAISADKLLNPERWKQNLCSGNFELPIEDSLLEISSNEEPTLIFAFEKREINNKLINYAYTFFVRNDNRSSYDFKIVFDDKFYFNLTNSSVEEKSVINHLEEASTIEKTGSFNYKKSFDKVCVLFDKAFPDSLSKKIYCREITTNVFNR